MISVVIPTHKPDYLLQAVRSVLNQTWRDFEIVVVPNGENASVSGLPEDPRIRVVPYVPSQAPQGPQGAQGPQGTPSGSEGVVGAIKRFAFEAARGDILVELDHDDLLASIALEEIARALADGTEFCYSNFAHFRDDEKPVTFFDRYWGWKKRAVTVCDRTVDEWIAFPPSPQALGLIYYAPNHVRAWSRAGYEKAGKHNPQLDVCDDHDLLIRTYLTGRMKHIDKCLYLYREHGDQTSTGPRNKKIQILTHQIYSARIEDLVLRWCSLNNLPAYDLGGGMNPRKGFIPVDLDGDVFRADLRKRWPWDDNSVGVFRAVDFLAYLPDKIHAMSEAWRCLRKGGWMLSLTPSSRGDGADMDPNHASRWNRKSFWYWTHKDYVKYIRGSEVRFQAVRLVEDFPTAWHRQENISYVTFDGVALKDGYDGPGAHDFEE